MPPDLSSALGLLCLDFLSISMAVSWECSSSICSSSSCWTEPRRRSASRFDDARVLDVADAFLELNRKSTHLRDCSSGRISSVSSSLCHWSSICHWPCGPFLSRAARSLVEHLSLAVPPDSSWICPCAGSSGSSGTSRSCAGSV